MNLWHNYSMKKSGKYFFVLQWAVVFILTAGMVLFTTGCEPKKPDPQEDQHIQQLNRRGYEYMTAGDYKNARTAFEESLARGDTWEARRGMAEYYYRTDSSTDEQIKHAGVAVALNPKDPYSHNLLGMAYHRRGDYPVAMKHFLQALSIDPKFAPALDNAGYASFYMGRDEEALEYFHRAIDAEPGFADSHCGLGMTLARQGRENEAEKAFNQAIRLNEHHSYSFYERGVLRIDRGDVPGALEDFHRALFLRPRWVSPLLERGLIYYHTGEFEKALKDFDQALKAGGMPGGSRGDEKDVSGHLHILSGLCHYRMGDATTAEARLEKGLEMLREEPVGLYSFDARGYALYLTGKPEIALNVLNHPGEALHRHLALSLIYRDRGDSNLAVETLKENLEELYPFWERKEAERLIRELRPGGTT